MQFGAAVLRLRVLRYSVVVRPQIQLFTQPSTPSNTHSQAAQSYFTALSPDKAVETAGSKEAAVNVGFAAGISLIRQTAAGRYDPFADGGSSR